MKDKILYSLIFIIIALTFTFYNYLLNLKEVYAYAGTIISIFISLVIYINTEKGKHNLNFLKETRTELSKITWSKREEYLPLTVKVIAILIASMVIIFMFDQFILKFIYSALY